MTLEIYNKSVDILLDAYNEGKLFHGYCNSCAVGTLLGGAGWSNDFYTPRNVMCQYDKKSYPEMHEMYTSKGFTRSEVMKIENTFEMAIKHNYEYYTFINIKEGQYLGLVAVLKVMETMVEEPVQALENMTRLQTIAHQRYNVAV